MKTFKVIIDWYNGNKVIDNETNREYLLSNDELIKYITYCNELLTAEYNKDVEVEIKRNRMNRFIGDILR